MAGIGFELRKILRKNTLFHVLSAYAYASIIGSGPWVLSIVGILLVGLLSVSVVAPAYLVTQFQVSVTYIIAFSLIVTGGLQLTLTRFVADRSFEKRAEDVLPNVHGILFVVMTVVAVLAPLLLPWLFPEQTLAYRLLFMLAFAELCCIWILAILLSGMKRYKAIVGIFLVGYVLTVGASLLGTRWGLEGLMGGFALGHAAILLMLWALILRSFPSRSGFDMAVLRPPGIYPSLILIGISYNFAVWADKLTFWFHPRTGDQVVGMLRASMVYDLPVFLAYLSIIPGMAVFLVRIETDFVEQYDKFYGAVRSGASLRHIRDMKREMILSIRRGLGEIAKIQGLVVLALMVAGKPIMEMLGLSVLFLPLLQIQAVAAAMQVMFLAIVNVLFYLDERRLVMGLCIELLLLNFALSYLSIELGPAFYGYGYALALLITTLTGLYIFDRRFSRLEYRTFMLQ